MNRSMRLAELRKRVYMRAAQGMSPDKIMLGLKNDIVKLGVSRSTAKDYLDTVVDQVGKK